MDELVDCSSHRSAPIVPNHNESDMTARHSVTRRCFHTGGSSAELLDKCCSHQIEQICLVWQLQMDKGELLSC